MSRTRATRRVLATLLFTDIVDSTALASALGDRRWKDVQARHHEVVRRLLRQYGGKELDTAGDGFFASFEDPASAIRCAMAASEQLRTIGLEIRAGAHVGQCEVLGGKLTGINVVVAARIMGLGGSGDVLISRTARDVVGGADIDTEERGTYELKGVGGEWDVFEVTAVDGERRSPPLSRDGSIERLSSIEGSGARRRWGMITVAIVAVVAIAGVGAVAARNDRHALSSAPVDSVAELDPTTGEIVDAVQTGKGPRGVVATSAGLWVAERERSIVEFIATDGRRQSIGLSCAPTSVAAEDDGSVWALCGLSDELVRIDESTQTADAPVDLRWPSGYEGLAVADGVVWVTNGIHRSLERIDASTGAPAGPPIRVPTEPSAITVGDGAAWFLAADALYRLEVSDGRRTEVQPVTLRWPGDAVTFGDGAVWVVHAAEDQVTRVDATDLQRLDTTQVGNQPQAIAVDAHGVWVPNYLDGTVTRIPLAGGDPVSFAVGQGPYGIATDGEHVWVTIAGRA